MVHIFLDKFLITDILILSYHICIKSHFKGSTFHDFCHLQIYLSTLLFQNILLEVNIGVSNSLDPDQA